LICLNRFFGPGALAAHMKSNRGKKKKKLKAADEHLMEVFREIKKAARRDKNSTPVADLPNDEWEHKQTQALDIPTKIRS
jgi:hypothetical protein